MLLISSDFNSPPPNKKNFHTMEGSNENKVFFEGKVAFDNDSHVRLRLSREEGKVNWANASVYNFKRGIQFYYDYNFIADGLSDHFGEAPYSGTYKAAIAFSSCKEIKGGRIKTINQHGTFHYDNEGKLKAIRSERIADEQSGEDAHPVCFKQGEYGLWSVLPFGGRDDLAREYYRNGGKLIRPIKANGHKEMILEMRYSLLSINEIMLFAQQSATGHVQKTIGVPLKIDIPEFARLLGSPNGKWTEVFQKFPSYIEIVK
jgi:hypothetical protein